MSKGHFWTGVLGMFLVFLFFNFLHHMNDSPHDGVDKGLLTLVVAVIATIAYFLGYSDGGGEV